MPAQVVELREVQQEDLATFFEQQLDPKATYMAAFTAEDPSDQEAFRAKWARILADPAIRAQTILADGRVAGHISKYILGGEPEITYWLGREFWGQGIASRALALFLAQLPERPLYGRAAVDNYASIRVLQKNGFQVIGRDTSYAGGRGEEVEEIILRLDRLTTRK